MSIANPPPYSNITGIAKSVNNYVDNVTANAYNGNARPGELVVALDTFNLYVGDDHGNLLLLSSGSGSDPAGGSNTQIQYNKNGTLAGDTHFTYDDSLHKVTLGGLLDLSELAVSVVSTDLIPSSNVALSLGNATNQWRDLWISNNTIYINSIPISLTANNDLTVDGNPVVTADPGNGATNVSSLDVSGALGAQTASVTGNITTGNYFVGDGGFISNINAGNITGLYSNANATALLADLGANAISSTGSVTAAYFAGDGANLTGLPASYSNANATSLLANLGANTISSTGAVTAAYFVGDGANLTGLPAGYSNAQAAAFLAALGANSVSTTGSVTAAHFAGEAGNLSNIQWANISGTPTLYSNTNVAAFLPTYTGNITANNITAGANITGNMILGNGALLSGLPAGYSNAEAAAYLASGTVSTNIVTSGELVANTVASSANLMVIDPLNDGNPVTGDVQVLGNLSVTGNLTYVDVSTAVTSNLQWTAAANANTPAQASGGGLEVGNAAAPYATWLYNSTANSWVSNIAIVAAGGANINGALTGATTGTFSGLLTAGNVKGEGGNLANIQWANITGVPALYSNANAAAFVAALGANSVSTTGTVTAANLIGEGSNISNIKWSNITGANAGIAAYLPTYTGTLTANTITASNTITAQTFVGNFQGNISGNIVVPGSNTWVLFNNNGNAGAAAGFTFNSATGVATATHLAGEGANISNIKGANITGEVALANSVSNAAQPNITSVGTLTSLSVTGNVTPGGISTAGNITAGYFIGSGALLTGLPAGYTNAIASAYLASGADTANINTSGNLVSANTLVLTGAGAAAAADTIVSSGQNGLSVGTANTAGVITIPAAANSAVRFTVLNDVTAGVTNTGAVWVQGGLNVWKSINVGGNVYTTGTISTAGNIKGEGGNITNVTAVTAQTVTANAQGNITSVGVLTSLSVSGATTAGSLSLGAGNLSLTGNTIKTTANLITIDPLGDGSATTGNVLILGNLSVAGNLSYIDAESSKTSNLVWQAADSAATAAAASGGGLAVGQIGLSYATWLYNSTANAWISNINISALGNVTAVAFTGNGATLANITGANVTGNVPSATIANTVTNNSQSNITSVGTLTALNVTGIISTAGNIKGEGGNISNIQAASISGQVANALVAGTVYTAAQGNITSVGTLTSLNVTGIISTAGNIKGEGGNISNITGSNVTGNVPSATIANTVTNPAQPNITSVGILTSVSVSGNAVAGNFNTAGLVSATGNVTGGNLNTAGLASVTGNVQAGNLRTAGLISAAGNITGGSSLAIGNTITALPNTVAAFGGNVDSYMQINIQNLSGGSNAESDLVITANNGSDTVNYINMGIVNSAYDPLTPTNSLGNIIYPTDGYLYAQGNVGNTSANGGNLAIGTTVSSKVVRIFAGGNTASNIVAVFSSDKITLGAGAGQTGQSSNAIAIGHMAGQSSQGNDAIAIGRQAGQASQATAAIGIGIGAGYSAQNGHAIAIGTNSGFMSQSLQSLAIGYNAASVSQAGNAIAIGSFAGASLQGNNAIAIGAMPNINNVSQGAGAISIGANAAANSQTANSIVINASGTAITASNTGFYAAPVRFDPANVGNSVYYNTVTKELTYASPQITTMDYIHVVRTTNQSWNSSNAAVLFDSTVSSSSTIGYNSATGVFTLTAGKTYRLAAGIPLDAAGGYNSFQWQYSGNTTPISSAKGVAATTSYGASSIEIVFTPTATTTVALKSLMSVGSTVYGGAWAVVQQLANSAVTTDLYLTGNITANVIGGYVGGNSVTLLNYKDSVYSLPYAATLTPDPALGSIQTVTLTGNVTLNNFGGTPQAGQSITMKIIQDATGNRILTSTMKWAGGFKTLSTTANAIDIATIWFDGTTYFGSLTRGYQ